jgi:hypothetical protein
MRFVVAVIVVHLAAGCATSPTEPTGSLRVSGLVLAVTAYTGVPGATVIFDPSETFNGSIRVPSSAATRGVTDDNGFYTLAVSAIGDYRTWVDDEFVGMSQVTGSSYRGDFFVRGGTTCVARYGTITDADTRKPVSGATVSITLSTATAMSGSDGWYRIDLGCPANGLFGFNTTFLSIKHPGYADFSRIIGRGVSGVLRLDCELQRR